MARSLDDGGSSRSGSGQSPWHQTLPFGEIIIEGPFHSKKMQLHPVSSALGVGVLPTFCRCEASGGEGDSKRPQWDPQWDLLLSSGLPMVFQGGSRILSTPGPQQCSRGIPSVLLGDSADSSEVIWDEKNAFACPFHPLGHFVKLLVLSLQRATPVSSRQLSSFIQKNEPKTGSESKAGLLAHLSSSCAVAGAVPPVVAKKVFPDPGVFAFSLFSTLAPHGIDSEALVILA